MSNRNITSIVAVPIAIIVCIAAVTYAPVVARSASLAGCGAQMSPDLVTECIFGLIESELDRDGLRGAMKVFSLAYKKYPSFANGGCHARAHRVGDVAYFRLYLKGGLDALDFPQETTACGYGFYHGFMEHLIQDNPRPEFITETCDRLILNLGARMRDIQTICYHGAGHGLVLAQIERMSRSEWGNVKALVSAPAELCKKLERARSEDLEQCYEGIFNVLVDTMALGQYGFTYDMSQPFAICATQPLYLREACIYEVAQKLDSVSVFQPAKMIEVVSVLPNKDDQLMAFGVGMAGIVQQSIATEGGYQEVLASCTGISETFYPQCVGSIVGGLFEHGEPQKEYQKALRFCEDPIIAERQVTKLCYEQAAARLPRFYTREKITSICREFPAAYREICAAVQNK